MIALGKDFPEGIVDIGHRGQDPMVTLQMISLKNLQSKEANKHNGNGQSTALMFRDSLVNANHGGAENQRDSGKGKAKGKTKRPEARSLEKLMSPEPTVRRIRRKYRKGTTGPRHYIIRIEKRR
jgi:hypothetical protein